MQTPAFVDGQFVDGSLLNGAVAQFMSDFALIGAELHTPGLLNPTGLTFTAPGGMLINVGAPSPFAVLFGNGLVVTANGVVSGATSSTYQVNFAPLVPTSGGAVTAFIVASYPGAIGEQQIQVIGPPEGHPDFDPTFAPFQFYLEQLGTIAIGVTTTAPDNTNTFELARTSLTVGQSTINASQVVSGAFWHYASAVLNPTGVVPGTYAGATVVVAADGRVSSVSGVAYGPLAGTNVWTGANQFNLPALFVDPNSNSSGGVVVSGSAAGATIMLRGTGTGSTPNKWLRALNGVLNILNNAYGVILTLTDSGNLTVPGAVTGNTLAAVTIIQETTGAFGSGDPTRVVNLGDFSKAFTNPGGFPALSERLPDGWEIKTGFGQSVTGNDRVNFQSGSFATQCVGVWCNEGNPVGWGPGPNGLLTSIQAAQSPDISGFTLRTAAWTGTQWDLGVLVAYRYIAIGF